MANPNDARRAHDVLDGLFAGRILSRENEQLLRSFLPELPKQKTLEELRHDVYDAWIGADGNEWADDAFGDLETWLHELHTHLIGIEDTPAAAPVLPAGMRLAEHEEYGRVVVAPSVTMDGSHMVFLSEEELTTGATWDYAKPDALTFIDAEPVKPAHPEFLETEADYQNAPEGTVVALDDTETVWLKRFGAWKSTDGDHGVTCVGLSASRLRVLRWGWSK